MDFSDPKLTIVQRHVADEERLITFLCRAFRNVSLQNSVEKVQTFNRMLTHIYIEEEGPTSNLYILKDF